jgi:hypothetical protein
LEEEVEADGQAAEVVGLVEAVGLWRVWWWKWWRWRSSGSW